MAYSNVAIGDILNGIKPLRLYNPVKALKQFHDTFSPQQRNDSLVEKIERRRRLVQEEYQEVMQALEEFHAIMTSSTPNGNAYNAKAELASELADLLYVVYGTAEELDIPIIDVFHAIHNANMRKVWDDGEVHRNEFGKVIKPPNFEKANIREVLYGAES